MDVPPLSPVLLRATPLDTQAAPGRPLQLSVGQRLPATVAQVLPGGETLVDVAGVRMAARSSVPLVAGEELELEVVRSGAEVQLRIVGSRAAATDVQRAAVALFQARSSASGLAQPPNAPPEAALREAVARLVTALEPPLPAADVRQLVQLLAAVPAGLDPARLAAALRVLVEHGGAFVESRLGAALAQLPPGASLPSLPPTVAADIRVLLGALARSLGRATASGAPGQGGERPLATASATAQTVRAANEQAAALGASSGESDPDAIGRLGHQVLAQQIDLALQWLRHGVIQAQVPLRFPQEESSVRLRIVRDAPRDPALAESAGRFHAFEVSLDLRDLGRIDARVQWAGAALSARFLVEREALVPVFEAELGPLVRGLNAAGFAAVTTTVGAGAVRATESDRLALEPPPGGSLLKVRG